MSLTTRNSLIKPELSDLFSDFISEYSTNMDTIDGLCAKANWTAISDPGVGDDSGDGYYVGSLWVNISGHKVFICENNTAGAAVWRQIWPQLSTDLSGTLDHGTQVSGLTDDDHTQYILAAGTRAFSAGILADQIATPANPASGKNKLYFKSNGLLYKLTSGGAESNVISADGLAADWDAGSYEIRAQTFESDVATGTAPLTIASTTKVTNLNSDQVDGNNFDTVTTKGDVFVASGAGDLDRLAVGSNGQILLANSAQSLGASWIDLMTEGPYRQALLNGSFQVNQSGVATYTSATSPANSDDTYLLDQWILLSDGNDIADVSQEATVIPTGGSASIKFDVETQNKKFGIVQIIENKDAIKYAGKYASLQFKARTTTGHVVENVRAAVLSWSSTADTVTSDVVATWNAEGANPTWATNWTAENTAANLVLVADTWTTYKIENIYVDTASMTNLAVFIWVDDTDCALEDLLYITDVQINEGAVCLPYMPRSFDSDASLCSYPISFTPTGSWSTNTTYTGQYQIINGRAFYDIKIVLSGAPDSAALTINLPHTIDTTRILDTTDQQLILGFGDILDAGLIRYLACIKYKTTTTAYIVCFDSSATLLTNNANVTQALPITFATGDTINLRFDVPIVGQSKKRL